MDITLLNGRELNGDVLLAWQGLQTSNSDLVSPYFSPEFTQAVAKVRDDVEVAVIREGGHIMAIFPFQRADASVGGPVGGILSDYQGIICRPEFDCDPRELLRKCRLVAWDFDHLLVSQECFVPFHKHHEASPLMDVSARYKAYVTERRAAGSEQIKKCGNLARRLDREVGPLRFVVSSPDCECLRQVLDLKSKQYLECGKQDLFATKWIRGLVEQIHSIQQPHFAGILSLLYAGDRLIAGHFGMRSTKIWHYWFPAYDTEFSKYSPGLILLLKMAEHAESIGVRAIDLGKGMSLYKERLMNASIALASGSVELPSLLSFRRGTRDALHAVVAKSPIAEPARRLVRRIRRGRTSH